jgi:GTPase SAR1 family protein
MNYIFLTQFIDLRLAVLGNVDAGKSTLLGVLTQGELDNGRGRARLNLFRHLHEIQSGRTSSISHEILGFNGKGEVRRYSKKLYKNYNNIFLYLLIIRIAVINVTYIYIFFKNSSIYIFNILILL